MSQDPYSDPVTGVLYNRLKLRSAAALEAAEREITHAALIMRGDPEPMREMLRALIIDGT